jgi:hypothetical protein
MLPNIGFMVCLNCPLLPDYVAKKSLGTGAALLGVFSGLGLIAGNVLPAI